MCVRSKLCLSLLLGSAATVLCMSQVSHAEEQGTIYLNVGELHEFEASFTCPGDCQFVWLPDSGTLENGEPPAAVQGNTLKWSTAGEYTVLVACKLGSQTIRGPDTWSVKVVLVEIEKCPADWDPKGGTEDNEIPNVLDPPNPGLRARVTPNTIKGAFVFFLTNVSDEPGYCMNAPVAPADPGKQDADDWKDLQFVVPQTGLTVTGTYKDRAETTSDELDQRRVKIQSYDYGAYGRLEVEFTVHGEVATFYGVEEGGNKEYVTIPRDEDDPPNHIRDLAPQNWGPGANDKAADDDKDNLPDPPGANRIGDKLQRYEEWRGFMVNGTHKRTDVTKRTVFLKDETNSGIGGDGPLSWFTSRTGLECHLIGDGEVNGSRVINFNGGANAQKAIHVERQELDVDRWGATLGDRPSGHQHCQADIQRIKHQLVLESDVAENAEIILYRGASEYVGPTRVSRTYQLAWASPGQINIGGNVVDYAEGVRPWTNDDTRFTSHHSVPSGSETILLDDLPDPRYYEYVRIDGEGVNEIVKMEGSPVYAKTAHLEAGITANSLLISTSCVTPSIPGDGNYYYARIGSGEQVEWVRFNGCQLVDNKWCLVIPDVNSRGVLVTTPRAHNANDPVYIPAQWSGCRRHELETQALEIPEGCRIVPLGVLLNCSEAEAHDSGEAFDMWGNVEDAVRYVCAHELGEAVDMSNDLAGNCIMKSPLGRGMYKPDGGLYDDYCDEDKGRIDAR